MNQNQLDIKTPFECKYRVELFAKIAWPSNFEHKKKTYWKTGKLGTNRATNLPAAEYETADTSERVWLLSNGIVSEE